jgi:hypothetical protein
MKTLVAIFVVVSLIEFSSQNPIDVETTIKAPSSEPKVHVMSKDALVGNDLFAYITKKMPDVCELSTKMRAFSAGFSTYGQRVIKEFIENFEETMKVELQSSEESNVPTRATNAKKSFKSLGMENFRKVLDIFGLSLANDSKDMCNFKTKLREALSQMDAEEMITVRMLFDKLKKQLEAKLPVIFSQTFAKNFEQINKLNMSDPDAIKTIGPLLSEFFNNATGL